MYSKLNDIAAKLVVLIYALFFNLLFNALESVEKLTQKGDVELSVHFDDILIYIREKNTCSGSLNRNGDDIVTSKQDKELHGFGIRNIRDSVKRYSGTVNIEVMEHSFVIGIILENMTPLKKTQRIWRKD